MIELPTLGYYSGLFSIIGKEALQNNLFEVIPGKQKGSEWRLFSKCVNGLDM